MKDCDTIKTMAACGIGDYTMIKLTAISKALERMFALAFLKGLIVMITAAGVQGPGDRTR